MKKLGKRIIALIISAVLAASMLMGCSSGDSKDSAKEGDKVDTNTSEVTGAVTEEENTDAIDTSEHVDLKMYLLGDRTPDFDEVYAKVNEILEEKLNCSLSVEFLSWSEHDTKYSLLFSSQEDFDLIFTATSWGHYEATAGLGGFYPLSEDFIKTYAPNVLEVAPEVAWDQAKINDQAYMVPCYFNDFNADLLAIRGDLMQKYGYDDIKTWDDMYNFYKDCAADGMYGTNGGVWWQYFESKGMYVTGGTPLGGQLFLHDALDVNDVGVYNVLDWDGFKEYCHIAKEMADAGVWSSDVLNNPVERQTGLLTGKTASMVWNLPSCKAYAKQANDENPDWNVTIVDFMADLPKRVAPYINGGMAINANSKNPERAMMVINELYTNKQLMDLTVLGIEGKHWEAVGDDQYKIIDESGYGVDANCNWGWRNENLLRTEFIENRTPLDDRADEIKQSFLANIKVEHPLDGFNFNNQNVTTQVAAVEAVTGTYFDPLINGLVDDVDKAIEELRTALESAGFRDIQAEVDKQVAEYMAKKQVN